MILVSHFAAARAVTQAGALQMPPPAAPGPAPGLVSATPVQIGAHAPSTPGLGSATAALLLVLALIVGLAWVLKRLPGGGLRQADGLRVVASIPLGSRERAAVVQVGGEQLLIGIGTGGVRTLHVLPEPLSGGERHHPSAQRRVPDFRQLLAQRLGKGT